MHEKDELLKENELPKVHKISKTEAEKIVSDLIGWNKPSVILEHIREFFEKFFLITEYPGTDYKSSIYGTYKDLESALKDLQNSDYDAEKIISEIVDWDLMDTMIENLDEMYDCFILYTDSMSLKDREVYYRSYKNVKFALEQINRALNNEVLKNCLST
jgi:hypothetical protein